MCEVRPVRPEELPAVHEFFREFMANDDAPDRFRDRYAAAPDLFVACFDDGDVVGAAWGRPHDEGAVELASVATHNDREGEGIGTRVVSRFEAQAAAYADAVSVASADNVEWFYTGLGYEPREILLQVAESDLPADYADRIPLRDERTPDPGTRFLYADFETYSQELRDDLKDRVNAFEVNTIFEKRL